MKVVAFERNLQGTGASRRLRNSGKTPGIVYGANAEAQAVELDHNALWHALKKEVFHSSILDLEIRWQVATGSAARRAIPSVQANGYCTLTSNVSIRRRSCTPRYRMHFMNQETNPAVKIGGAVISHVLNEVEIECLPADLPEFVELDLAKIEAGHTLHVKDIVLAEGRDAGRSPRRRKPGDRFGDCPGCRVCPTKLLRALPLRAKATSRLHKSG